MTPLADPLVQGKERTEFREFIGAMFGQRRKQLSRALRTVTGRPKDEIDGVLGGIEMDRTVRPEALSPEELLEVFRAVLGEKHGA